MLVVNDLGRMGSPQVRICIRGSLPFRFLDPLVHQEADLLPSQTWDYVRIFEQAVLFCHNYLNIDILPRDYYKSRTYLYYLGYPRPVAGYMVRPKLPHKVVHAEIFSDSVSQTSLTLPGMFPGVGVPRAVHDSASNEVREKSLCNIKYLKGKSDPLPVWRHLHCLQVVV